MTAATHGAARPAATGRAWPLTGRGAVLEQVLDAVRRRSHPAGVVLAGTGGTGTTRLAREALARTGMATRWVAASWSGRTIPFGAFAALAELPSPVSVARALLAGTGGRLVLGVDDAHLLDGPSAAVIRQLVQQGAVTVVLTLRAGVPAPDAVTALWTEDHLPRIELGALTGAASRELVETVLGGPLDGLSAARLWSLTRGNPQFLRQVVDDELDAGRLYEADGVWRWRDELVPSARLVELVTARVGPRLDGRVGELLALAGPLDVAVLERLVPAGAVEDAERCGLVRVYAEGGELRAGFADPLYGPVVAAQISSLWSRRLRTELSTVPDLVAVPAALTSAAERLDVATADQLLRPAADGVESRLARGWVTSWQGRADRADERFAEIAQPGARVTVARAVNLAVGLGRPVDAAELLRAAPPDPLVDAVRVALDVVGGRPSVVADPDGVPDAAVAWAGLARTMAQGLAGVMTTPLSDRARAAAARALDTAWLRCDIAGAELMAYRMAGELDAAARRCAELATIDPRFGPSAAASCSVMAGLLALDRGLVATATRRLREAVVDPGTPWIGWSGWAVQRAAGLAQALGTAGDAAGARGALEAAGPVPGWLRPQVTLGQAWAAAAEGASSDAMAFARRASVLARRAGQLSVEVTALHTAVRLGDRTVADRLVELAATVDGPRAAIAAVHASAVAADDGRALDGVATRWLGIGALLLAADAAAQATLAHRRAGSRGAAYAAAGRAAGWARDCEGARTPALLAAARPLPLTGREREITMLASTGLTNRAIAHRLRVSVRTVEGHLYRACSKLAVPDRSGLAAVLLGP